MSRDGEVTQSRHNSRIFGGGICGTVIWASAITVCLLRTGTNAFHLGPGELGSFLAGAVAPLAFLWIVVGYFLQAKPLGLQQSELADQVKSRRELIEAEKDRADREKAVVQPRFIVDHVARPGDHLVVEMRNVGKDAYNFRRDEAPSKLTVDPTIERNHLPTNSGVPVSIRGVRVGSVNFLYMDIFDRPHFCWLHIDEQSNANVGKPDEEA